MVKLDTLSRNLIQIIQEIIRNQSLVKYIAYNNVNPLSQPDLTVPAQNLMFKNINPYPFDMAAELEDSTQIRVYFPSGQFSNSEVITDITVTFDIIVAKSLWLINDGTPLVRPYEMMKIIIGLFSNKSIGTLGKMKFNRFMHLSVNERFNAIRIEAKITSLATG